MSSGPATNPFAQTSMIQQKSSDALKHCMHVVSWDVVDRLERHLQLRPFLMSQQMFAVTLPRWYSSSRVAMIRRMLHCSAGPATWFSGTSPMFSLFGHMAYCRHVSPSVPIFTVDGVQSCRVPIMVFTTMTYVHVTHNYNDEACSSDP